MPVTEAQRLRIATRYVGQADAEPRLEMTVPCPMNDGRVSLEQCVECEHGGGLLLGPMADGSFLRCGYGTADGKVAGKPKRWGTTASRTPVASVMTRGVVTVSLGTTLQTVMGAFLEHAISGIPVVDEEGRPVGLVSKTDVLRDSYDEEEAASTRWPEAPRPSEEVGAELELREAPRTVDEVMSPVVYMLSEQAPLAMAAALMATEGIHRVPIVTAEGRLAGILSSIDVMRWLSLRAGYILPPTA